jgi:circadian clock protein KaiC
MAPTIRKKKKRDADEVSDVDPAPAGRVSTGIEGLDEITNGGLVPRRAYLVRGKPGTGKTTVGLHFLVDGVARGERVLCIALAEPVHEIRDNAESVGIDLSGVEFLDLSPTAAHFTEDESYDVFSAAEVERAPVTRQIVEAVEKLKPQRVFLDAITVFRYLARDPYEFRKQILSFIRYLVDSGATVVYTSEGSPDAPDHDLEFMSDGVIVMDMEPVGRATRRTASVTKFRGSATRSGRHTVRLTAGGVHIFPRLVPEQHAREFKKEDVPSGVPALDELLHGGLQRGTVTILTGPSGVGKTTLGMQFMKEAAGRGERSVIYTFEEHHNTLLARSAAINIPVQAMVERGTLDVVQIEPITFTPDEFADMVREEVEERNASIVMIDSLAGYRISLLTEDLIRQVHSLVKYLRNMGVTVVLVNELDEIVGHDFRATDAGVSYLADTIIFLRYLEIEGEMRKAIGVLKKRTGDFQKALREFEISRYGIRVGKPLRGLRGLLSGSPEWTDGDHHHRREGD